MPKAKLRAALVGGSAEAVEAQFYEAIQTGDVEKFMACWADEDDIVCIYPNRTRLVGSVSIRAAFQALLALGNLAVRTEHLCKVESLTSAMHNLIQRVSRLGSDGRQEEVLTVTNVYQRTPQGWRIVAHHASQGATTSPIDIGHTGQVLH